MNGLSAVAPLVYTDDMSKKNKQNPPKAASYTALLLSFWFVYSVITNARDLVQYGEKNAPASYALVLGLLLMGFAWYQNNKTLNKLHIVTLTVLATALVIWVAGLSATPLQ